MFDDPLIVINLCAALSACANLEALTLRGASTDTHPLLAIGSATAHRHAHARRELCTARAGVLPGFDQSANAVVQALQTCGNLSTLVLGAYFGTGHSCVVKMALTLPTMVGRCPYAQSVEPDL